MNPPLTILHFLTDLDRHSGGPSVSVPQVCRELASHDDTRVILAARPSPDAVEVETDEQFSVRWISGSRSSVREVFEETESSPGGDKIVVHLQGLWDPMFHWATRYATRQGYPIVVSIRGMLLPWALKHKRLKKSVAWHLYQRRNLKSASALHATSPAEIESIEQAGFIGQPPSFSIPNGVIPPANRDQILAESNRSRTLLFLGRIHPVKGLLPLLDAWAKAAPEGWNLQLTGPDWEGHQRLVEEKIQQHQVQDSVQITGAIEGDAKWRALAGAGCVVLPSFAENFGMSVAEALAMETPVAASTRSPWEILATENAGWWVEPKVADLTRFLETLGSTSTEDLEAMGKRGRGLVERDFTWPAVGQKLVDLYRELASSAPP